jgi:hypothetical protein
MLGNASLICQIDQRCRIVADHVGYPTALFPLDSDPFHPFREVIGHILLPESFIKGSTGEPLHIKRSFPHVGQQSVGDATVVFDKVSLSYAVIGKQRPVSIGHFNSIRA